MRRKRKPTPFVLEGLNIPKRGQAKPLDVPPAFVDFAQACRIRSGQNIVPFKLFDYQIELSNILDRHRGLVVYKTRQLGLTETIACKFLHKACLNPAYLAGVLSIGQEESSNVARRIRTMPQVMPGVKFGTNNLRDLEVKRGGRVIFRPSTPTAIRSLESVSDLLFDEAAFVPEVEEIYSSAVPAQEMAGDKARTVIVSTMSPAGKTTWFWKMLTSNNESIDVERLISRIQEGAGEPFQYWVDDSGWAKVLLHWRQHPFYASIPNYLEKIKKDKKLTDDKLQREYNLGIPESGGVLFDSKLLERAATGHWLPPFKNRRYLLSCDPNFGGTDYFVSQVWDCTEWPVSLVHEYRSNRQTVSAHQQQTLTLIDYYKPEIVAIEVNSGGKVILENLIEKRPDVRFEPVSTNATSKKVNTDRVAIALENGRVRFPSDWPGILEAKQFGRESRKAISGHDDSVMAWAIAFCHISEILSEAESGRWLEVFEAEARWPGISRLRWNSGEADLDLRLDLGLDSDEQTR